MSKESMEFWKQYQKDHFHIDMPAMLDTYAALQVANAFKEDAEALGCEAGCKVFSGGERKHHPDCCNYPRSLTEMYADKDEKIKELEDKIQSLYEEMAGEDL